MTDNNIENIVMPNTDEENMKLVKDLVKQMRLESSKLVSDTRHRSRALCDLQNVCNIVAHVKEKMQARSESEYSTKICLPIVGDEEGSTDHLLQVC